MNRIWPTKIITPHVDLGVSLHVGVAVLKSTGAVVSEEVDGEKRTYRVSLPGYQMAIYDGGGFVSSVWYDDPAGRLTPFGKRRKIKLYMDRFTKNGSWQLRINNGWMKFSRRASMSAGTNGLQRHAGRIISFPACYAAAAAGTLLSSRTATRRAGASIVRGCARAAAAPTRRPFTSMRSNAACSPAWRSN
jgi:hypothetical protein